MKIPDLYKIVNKEVIPMQEVSVGTLEHLFREAGHDPTDVYVIIVTDTSSPLHDLYISKETLEPFMAFCRPGATLTYKDCEKALKSVDWKLEIGFQEYCGR